MGTYYERKAQWATFSVHPARTGWVVKGWSRIRGTYTHWARLLPYRPTEHPSQPLDRGLGDKLIDEARDGEGRTLRRGFKVR